MQNNLILSLFLSLLLSTGVLAHAEVKEIEISNTTIHDLANETASALTISVPYPGPMISHVCGLEIRANSGNPLLPIEKLAQELKIRELSSELPTLRTRDATTLDIGFDMGTYEVWFELSTQDGSSFQEVIRRTISDNVPRQVLLMAKSCP